jgi:DNA end-binding protein Ku
LVLTSREHIIALEPLKNGLMGTLLRYPYEVRSENEYFDDIQDVKVTKDMLDLAQHIVQQKTADFDPSKFDDRYESALLDLINQKQAGTVVKAHGKERPNSNVVDLMTALKQTLKGESSTPKKATKSKKTAPGQKEMLLPIAGKKPAAVVKRAAKSATRRKAS